MHKKGEAPKVKEGASVAVILIIIAFAIALYIILVSPEEREKLLTEDLGYDGTSTSEEATTEVTELITESPGRLSPVQEYGNSHDINSVNLFVKTEPKVIDLAKNLYVKKNLFSSSSPRLRFDIEKVPDLKKVLIYFNVNDPSGTLKISVNDYTFFSDKIETEGVQLIELPLHYLKERNLVEFTVSTPFIGSNHYDLSNVGIKEEFERINSKEERTFMITAEEKANIKEASLNYFMYCNSQLRDETTNFKIILNNNQIYDAEIKCMSAPQTVEINSADIIAGQNTVVFLLQQGDFSLNQIHFDTTSDKLDFKTYYFTLSRDDFQEIRAGDKDINLEFLMEDDEREKSAKISINDGAFYMKTIDSKYEMDIQDYVQQGTNFLRIQPGNTFTLSGLRIYFEE